MSNIVVFSENGVSRPVFLCDSCKAPIEDARLAVLKWPKEESPEFCGSGARIVCGECDLRFPESEATHRDKRLDLAMADLLETDSGAVEKEVIL